MTEGQRLRSTLKHLGWEGLEYDELCAAFTHLDTLQGMVFNRAVTVITEEGWQEIEITFRAHNLHEILEAING